MSLSSVSSLFTHGVSAWPPPGPLPNSFQFHHQGSNFAIFVIFFALCMMEVVVLRIITEEQARNERGRSVTSMWFDLDDENERGRACLPAGSRDICTRCGGDTHGGPVPCICLHHRPVKFESGAWFLRQLQRAASLMPWTISTDKLEQIEEECESPESPGPGEAARELRSVREFLEALSARLAGGPLETASVAPLYTHPAYLPPARTEPASSSASNAHAQLKRLVARVVEEAAALPAFSRSPESLTRSTEPTRAPPADTYEDLLATAILNKVIERYQTEGSGGRSSGIHSASASPSPSDRSSPRSLHSRHTRERDISPPLREEDDVSDWEEGATEDAIELPRRSAQFPDFSGDFNHTDNDDRDFDEVSGSEIQPIDGTWEENWLFQKKKIKTIQSVPVPMLVPNSNAEYKAMIGDRDADDTTDLSDNASDAEEIDYKSDIKRVLDSKHVIGGAPKIDDVLDFEPDSLTIIDGSDDFEKLDEKEYMQNKLVDVVNNEIKGYDVNGIKLNGDVNGKLENDDSVLIVGVDSGPLTKAEFALKEEIHRTLLNGNVEAYIEDMKAKENDDVFTNGTTKATGKATSGPTSTLSRHEREQEYEETVTLPVQRYADSLRRKHFDDEPQEIPTRDTDHEDDLIPGSIAYRERKKWLNYVEMPNNPYSPEAIQKRLSTKSTSSLFDTLTSKSKIDDDKDEVDGKEHKDEIASKEDSKPSLSVSTEDIHMNGRRSKSPSPRILKNVLAEEIPQYKRYGRDYYLKEAKASSGSRKKGYSDTSSVSSMNKSTSLDNFDTELTTPGLLIKQFNSIASNQQYKKFAGNEVTIKPVPKLEIMIDYEDVNEQTLFSAKPVYLDDDEKKFEEILQTYEAPISVTVNNQEEEPQKSPSNLSVDNSYLSSSSLEDSIKIYNVQTGEIVKCKPEDNVSPVPRYDTDGDLDIDIDKEQPDSLSPTDVVIVEDEKERLENISEIEEILAQLPKVKELAKKFVSMDNLNETVKPSQLPPLRRQKSKENILSEKTNKLTYMHSLTARSISREFREELKLSMATPLKVPGGSKEIPEGTEDIIRESSRPGSPLPEPGTIKTKLAFFESLKSKFNSK